MARTRRLPLSESLRGGLADQQIERVSAASDGLQRGSVCAGNVDGNRHFLATAAQQDAADGADILVVAPMGNRDVLVSRHDAVGGIEVDPAGFRRPHREPSVRRVGALQFLHAGWRIGEQIAADVPGWQAESTQARDRQMREVLADAAPLGQDMGDGLEMLVAVPSTVKSR